MARVLFKLAEPMPLWQGFCRTYAVVARVLFKLILYDDVVLWKNWSVHAFRNWHCFLTFLHGSCKGTKAAVEERLHDILPFTTRRLCMPRQLRNMFDENYIAFFFKWWVIVALFSNWYWNFQPLRFLVSCSVIFRVGSTWRNFRQIIIWEHDMLRLGRFLL